MKHKILIAASTKEHIVRFHLPYLKYFFEYECEIHVVCAPTIHNIPYVSKIFEVPFKKSIYSLSNLYSSCVLWKIIRLEKYDLIITHTSLASFFTRLSLLFVLHKPSIVVMVHGYLFDKDTFFLRRWLLLTAEIIASHRTDGLIVMNREDYDMATKYNLGKHIEFVPGVGVDYSRFDDCVQGKEAFRKKYSIDLHRIVLIYAAEFSHRKNHSFLLYAMSKLSDEVLLVLAGDGSLKPDCQRLAIQLGVAQRVLFLGHVEDMAGLYQMADIAVTSSRYEGLPFNVMESMYYGLPVVASDVKGNRDLVLDGVTGFLYPYGDEDAFVQAVNELCVCKDLRGKLGRQGKENVRQYGMQNVFPVVLQQYLKYLP